MNDFKTLLNNVAPVIGISNGQKNRETVYKEKLVRIRQITNDAIDQINDVVDPSLMTGVLIEALNAISTEVAPD